MKYALGCKLVQFEPMTQGEFITRNVKNPILREVDATPEGYKVVYEDGYESWAPKETFERFYFPLTDPEGSKISPEDIDRMLHIQDVHDKDEKTTEVKATTLTGFVQYAYSSCVDPENYDQSLGFTECLKRIKEPIWKAFGFTLQWARFGLKDNVK